MAPCLFLTWRRSLERWPVSFAMRRRGETLPEARRRRRVVAPPAKEGGEDVGLPDDSAGGTRRGGGGACPPSAEPLSRQLPARSINPCCK